MGLHGHVLEAEDGGEVHGNDGLLLDFEGVGVGRREAGLAERQERVKTAGGGKTGDHADVGHVGLGVEAAGHAAVVQGGGHRLGAGESLRAGHRGGVGGGLELALGVLDAAEVDDEGDHAKEGDHDDGGEGENLATVVVEEAMEEGTCTAFHWTASEVWAVRVQPGATLKPKTLRLQG